MKTYQVQRPTRRFTFWGVRDHQNIRADSASAAAVQAAKAHGSGRWSVNVKDPTREDDGLYSSFTVRIH